MHKLLLSLFVSFLAITPLLADKDNKKSKHEEVFTDIFIKNKWNDSESVSGMGSNTHATKTIREELPKFFSELEITSLLDIPCGDFNWMKQLNWEGITYIGADIVEPLIEKNKTKYSDQNKEFRYIDAITDPLPKVDLIFCRDMLVHLTLKDAKRVLQNFKASGSRYLLVTTHTLNKTNKDIKTGYWRKLNFERPPFNFPEPLLLIAEESPEKIEYDKHLALWRLEDLFEN